jgi:hypothetical protein
MGWNSKLNELKAAVRDKDGAKAAQIVTEMRKINPQATDKIVNQSVQAGQARREHRSN